MNDNQSNDLAEMMCRVTAATVAFDALSPAEREAVLRMQVETLERIYGQPKDDLASYVKDHRVWSEKTFVGTTAKGITAHIEKECAEVRKEPEDLEEWIDIMILAIDGYWRHGGVPEELLPRLRAKQRKNIGRKWVSTGNPDEPVEHDRSEEAA